MTAPEPPSLTWPPPWLHLQAASGAPGRSGQTLAWPPPWLEPERADGGEPAVAAEADETEPLAEAPGAAEPLHTVEPDAVADDPEVGEPVGTEEQAILDLAREWGPIDRTYRALAYRGSYTGRVFLPVATVRRILRRHRVRLPGEPPRPDHHTLEIPEVPWEPGRIWMWESARFPAADRVAHALVDVVTRYWLGLRLSLYEAEAERDQLVAAALTQRYSSQERDDRVPLLVSWSDGTLAPTHTNGPTERITVESLFSILIGESPELVTYSDGHALERELTRLRTMYNDIRLHPGLGYVTPADEHEGRGPGVRRARRSGLRQARLRREV